MFHLFIKTINVDVDGIGEVSCDIAYGGNFYGIIDARDLNLDLTIGNTSEIIDMGIQLRHQINATTEVIHPEYPFIKGLTHMEFFTDPEHPEANVKNTVVVPPGGIDKSPCGTGTSVKLAVLYQKGDIKLKEMFVHESIVGSLFKARVIETTKVQDVSAIIPEVTGSASCKPVKTVLVGLPRYAYLSLEINGQNATSINSYL